MKNQNKLGIRKRNKKLKYLKKKFICCGFDNGLGMDVILISNNTLIFKKKVNFEFIRQRK